MPYSAANLISNLVYILEKHKEYICIQYKPTKELLQEYNQWIDTIKNSQELDWNQFQKFILSLTEFSENSLGLVRSQYSGIIFELVNFMKEINVSEVNDKQILELAVTNMTEVLELKSIGDIKTTIHKSLGNLKNVLSAKEEHYSQIKVLTNRINTISEDLEKTQNQLKRDTFTDLYNKASFNEKIKKIAITFDKKKTPLSNHLLIILDIDNFKRINDKYGHQKGDATILALSSILKVTALQTNGYVARFGGDEFSFLCEIDNLKAAAIIIKNLIEKIRQLEIRLDNSNGFNVTCSIGASLLQDGEDDQKWLDHADKALYHAKNKGKNTFVIFLHKG